MSKKKDIDFVGNPHFALDNAVFNDTVMEKIRNRNLNLTAVKVYMYLARNRDIKTGKLHGTKIEKIADYWSISTRAVHRGLADLTAAGLYKPPLRGSKVVNGKLLPNRKKED